MSTPRTVLAFDDTPEGTKALGEAARRTTEELRRLSPDQVERMRSALQRFLATPPTVRET